jgi:hypothetical protein
MGVSKRLKLASMEDTESQYCERQTISVDRK